MSKIYKSEIRYENGFDRNIERDGVEYRYVSYRYTRWVVNGRILEPGDPAEPNPQPIFGRIRPSLLSLGVS